MKTKKKVVKGYIEEPKLLYGRYKGYTVHYTSGGQIFGRAGFYLSKSINGVVKDIIYLEEALPKKVLKSNLK